jgi:hypothetical protein
VRRAIRTQVLLRPILGVERAELAIERLLEAVGERSDDVSPALTNARQRYNVAKAILDGRRLELEMHSRASTVTEAEADATALSEQAC